MHSEVSSLRRKKTKRKKKKPNLEDVSGLVVLAHSALLYGFSCGTRPLTLPQSISFAPSRLLSLSIL